MADGSQHPPQTGSDGSPAIVVSHHAILVADAEPAHANSEGIPIRQRMPPRPVFCRQVGVEVYIDRTGDVGLEKGLPPPLRLSQVPAGVRQPKNGMVQVFCKPVGAY